jgi:8-oxo-dGTP pyrophosphatase MutT (NUDIX family)
VTPAVAPDWFEQLVTAVRSSHEPPFGLSTVPEGATARRSAVLILFGPGSTGSTGPVDPWGPASTVVAGSDVLLTQRSAQLRSHAGQVAFPGGRVDPDDAGAEAAALREAVEETGLDPAGVALRATAADLYLPPSNYLVTPVIGWWERPSPVAPGDPAEVARVVGVPVAALVDPQNRFVSEHPSGFRSPGFQVGDLFVWGFTAGVLHWLISLSGLEQPWDKNRRRPVPKQYLIDRTTDRTAGRTLVQELTEQLDERVPE